MNQNQWINHYHLFYFKTIAEQGTVLGAAQKLHLGQPTLSAQLKQFEDTIGVQLFERKHKKLVLTEQGKVALDYAKNIFSHFASRPAKSLYPKARLISFSES